MAKYPAFVILQINMILYIKLWMVLVGLQHCHWCFRQWIIWNGASKEQKCSRMAL